MFARALGARLSNCFSDKMTPQQTKFTSKWCKKFFTFLAPLRNEIMFKNFKPAPLRQKILATPLMTHD